MAKQYSEEKKAAVLAALLLGQSVAETAEMYKVPVGTVKSWKSRQGSGTPVAKVATQKREIIGDLLVEYLAENIVTLKAQAIHARDEKWMGRQQGSDFAVLHGVFADKAIRLLEAFAKSAEVESE